MNEATHFSYRPELPSTPAASKALWKEMRDIQRKAGATFFRYTYFDYAHPSELYPHGLYLEGWDKQPREQPPFDFPMTAISPTETGK